MEVAGIKAQRQTWSEADVYKLKNAVKRAQGTDDAGVNWASVSMELGRSIAHVKKKWGRLKLDSGKASGGHYQAQFSQLRHCRRSKCANLVEWFNNHLHSPYPGSQELERLAASNGLTRNQVVLVSGAPSKIAKGTAQPFGPGPAAAAAAVLSIWAAQTVPGCSRSHLCRYACFCTWLD